MKCRNSRAYMNELRRLHLEYFEHVDELPKELYFKIRDSLVKTTKKLKSDSRIKINLPKDSANVHTWLKAMHNCMVLR